MLIRFQKDWDLYPDAVWDTTTTNTSFMRFSGLLKAMGVQNHLWPLQLFDRSLMGVNPRDKNLTVDQKRRIIAECKNNFMYFLREVMIIPGSDERETVRFEFNRGVASMYWLYFCHIVPYIVMIRQVGKSFGMDTLDIWLLNVRLFFGNMSLVTKNERLRTENMRRIKEIEKTLPSYLIRRLPTDPANNEQYRVSQLSNTLKAHIAPSSPKVAEGLGRGLTDQHFRFDELAYLFNIRIVLPAALASGGNARDRAHRRGDPYGTILATTAGKKDDRDGAYAYELMMESSQWGEHLYDAKDEDDLRRIIRASSKAKDDSYMVYAAFIHRQLGKSDEWLRLKISDAKAVGEDAERDFGNRWTSGGLVSPFNPDIAETIRNSQILEPHIEIDERYRYTMRWYGPSGGTLCEAIQQPTIASLDASDGIGRDDLALVVRSVSDGSVIAAGNFNNLNIFEFSSWLCDFLKTYPKMVFLPEMKSSARSITDHVCYRLIEAGENPFKRIYNTVVQEGETKADNLDLIRRYGTNPGTVQRFKDKFGFITSGSGENARNMLFGRNLTEAARLTGRSVRDVKTIDQILGLVIRNGRLDHAVNGHDDLCVAWLLGYWFLTSARNVEFYGISPSQILKYADYDKEFKSPEERYRSFVSEQLRARVDSLAEQMRNEPNDNLYRRLENQIRALLSGMPADHQKTYSESEFFSRIREERNLRTNNYA